MKTHRWIFPEEEEVEMSGLIASEFSLPPLIAGLLCRRGCRSVAEAELFLQPRLQSLSDPFLLPDMEKAVDRILRAVDAKERIVLFGDYDVDGVTSLALFKRILRAYGAEVECFLPMRMDEGYGLGAEAVARCQSTLRPQLLLALDCGTSSAREIAGLRKEGVDVIVFDHHECKAELPDCAAVVNPKRGKDFHYLCSVGIVFKACHALLKRRPAPGFDLRDCLDLVALGTVADIVPLVQENRILVKRGLEQIDRSKWPGVRALAEAAGVKTPARGSDIGFRLGPRLNASGRLGTAADALELLLTVDAARARELAASLDTRNRERQEVELAMVREAEEMILRDPSIAEEPAIVLGKKGWHPGVLGIVASRLAKSHHRPAIVIGFDERGEGKGSGRSVEGYSLVTALAQCAGVLEKYGGHEMAAGVTLRMEAYEEFRRAFLGHARATLTEEQLRPRLILGGELELGILDLAFLGQHDLLQPFGMGNPQPIFFTRGVSPEGEPRQLKEKHLSLRLRQGGSRYQAIYFNAKAAELPAPPWDVAFKIERNEYNGRVSAQMQVVGLRSTEFTELTPRNF